MASLRINSSDCATFSAGANSLPSSWTGWPGSCSDAGYFTFCSTLVFPNCLDIWMQVAAGRLLNSHQEEAVTLLQVSSYSWGESHFHDDDLYIINRSCLSETKKLTPSLICSAMVADPPKLALPPTWHLSLGNASDWKLIIIIMNMECLDDDGLLWSANIWCKKEKKSSELIAVGAKQGARSLPMRTVPSRRST